MRVIARIFCTILAAALAIVALITLVEIALAASSRDGWLVDSDTWFDTVTQQTWSSAGLRVAFALAGVAGLLLLAVAWAPRRALTVPATVPADDVTVTVRRRGAEEVLRSRLTALPYITAARAEVTKDRVDVVAHATRDDDTTSHAVQASVSETIDRLALGDVPQRVRVRRSAGRVA